MNNNLEHMYQEDNFAHEGRNNNNATEQMVMDLQKKLLNYEGRRF